MRRTTGRNRRRTREEPGGEPAKKQEENQEETKKKWIKMCYYLSITNYIIVILMHFISKEFFQTLYRDRK